jgi:hypothetical protein
MNAVRVADYKLVDPYERIAVVEWEDAWTEDGWNLTADAHEKGDRTAIIWSVGYVMKEDNNGIVLVSGVTKDGFGSMWKIPNGMIISVTHMGKGPPA